MQSEVISRAKEELKDLGIQAQPGEPGLPVYAPAEGALLTVLVEDTADTVREKALRAREAQRAFANLPRSLRENYVAALSDVVRSMREPLASLVMLEGGKTSWDALTEADSAADILKKTIADASLADLSDMQRTKERLPLGVVGLITSFNFPLVVANWTIAPALLAGNGVLWKPSEKTPLTALAYKDVFKDVMGEYADILQIVVGGRDVGQALVTEPGVGMISATGSVAMGKGIRAATAQRTDMAKPILELGGNNGVIITGHVDDAHRDWALSAILTSFLGSAGQRCTNTRRLIVHSSQIEAVMQGLQQKISDFVQSGAIVNPLAGQPNDYGYGPLIDADAYSRFERAKSQVQQEWGMVWGGQRLLPDYPDAYYVAPALARMARQTPIMHEETFGPLLYVAPYDGDVQNAIPILNEPANAGLVAGIYTQSQVEADIFALSAEAGHVLINSPRGTGTPAFGMGFGGNKESGEGEILNSADPLRPFVRDTQFRRIAQNTAIEMKP